jgi:hypothetical protein
MMPLRCKRAERACIFRATSGLSHCKKGRKIRRCVSLQRPLTATSPLLFTLHWLRAVGPRRELLAARTKSPRVGMSGKRLDTRRGADRNAHGRFLRQRTDSCVGGDRRLYASQGQQCVRSATAQHENAHKGGSN